MQLVDISMYKLKNPALKRELRISAAVITAQLCLCYNKYFAENPETSNH